MNKELEEVKKYLEHEINKTLLNYIDNSIRE